MHEVFFLKASSEAKTVSESKVALEKTMENFLSKKQLQNKVQRVREGWWKTL